VMRAWDCGHCIWYCWVYKVCTRAGS